MGVDLGEEGKAYISANFLVRGEWLMLSSRDVAKGYEAQKPHIPLAPIFWVIFNKNLTKWQLREYSGHFCTLKTLSLSHFWLHPCYHPPIFYTENSLSREISKFQYFDDTALNKYFTLNKYCN